MYEPIPNVQRAVGQLLLVRAMYESIHVLKHFQSLFDFSGVDPGEPRHDRRIERGALHAGRGQQLPVSVFDLFDFPLDHAADRFGERVRDIGHGLR